MSELFIHTLHLDGKGSASPLKDPLINGLESGTWVHISRDHPDAEKTLGRLGVEKISTKALLMPDTRPRFASNGETAIMMLRGVNLNPDQDPEDMVSIRLWTDGKRVVSVRGKAPLMAVADTVKLLENNNGPTSPIDLIIMLADRLTERMVGPLVRIEEHIDTLEDDAIQNPHSEQRRSLGRIRLQALILRRFIAPQRDALFKMGMHEASWMTTDYRLKLREVADRVTRFVEDLDAVRDRAVVIHDEITSHIAEDMNNTMYLLTIVAAIFLPLGLLTGLLGINVGGMPGANDNMAFWIVTGGLVVVGVLEYFLMKKLKWI